MSRFRPHERGNAALKAGLLGFAGSGKTRTATEIAIGLVQHLRVLGIEAGTRPVWMLDTEGGADYVMGLYDAAGIVLESDRSRAFVDLIDGCRAAEGAASVLVIDNITHVWREFCDAYQRKRNRRRLEFQDWGYLKTEWQKFTDLFLSSPVHIIMCGRAGYEYEHTEDENGRKELVKTGVKMKAEGEMAYEPSLLLYLERETDPDTHRTRRVAHVLKDRFAAIDGKSLSDPATGGPTFAQLLPHIERLHLGGQHRPVDTTRTSDAAFPADTTGRWRADNEQRALILGEIREELVRAYPGQTAADKKAKGDLLELAFGSRAWERAEQADLPQLREAAERIWQATRGTTYGA